MAGAEASTDGGATLAAGVVAGIDGAVEPAGVLHATTAPPSDAARARLSKIRFNMGLRFLRCQGYRHVRHRIPALSGIARSLGAATATHDNDRGQAGAQ